MVDSRSDISQLEDQHPVLYSSYQEPRGRISSPLASLISAIDDGSFKKNIRTSHMSISEAISQRSSDVEDEIRGLPGFERFQLPTFSDNLVTFAENGPLVSFIVTEFRSDALLVIKCGINSVTLAKLEFTQLQIYLNELIGEFKLSKGRPSTKNERNKRLREILSWLWEVAVRPVLHVLTLTYQVKEITTHLVGDQWNHGTSSDSCDRDI
jgi:hypothetical protein